MTSVVLFRRENNIFAVFVLFLLLTTTSSFFIKNNRCSSASFTLSAILSQDGDAELVYGKQKNYKSSASMLPKLPSSGRALKLFTSPDSGLLGATTVWPAAHALCCYLLNNEQTLDLKNANCVEVGSGTGAVGLFAAGLGARHVVLTDCKPPPDSVMYTTDGTSGDLPVDGSDAILNLLQQNNLANQEIFPSRTRVDVMELNWKNQSHVERVVKAASKGGGEREEEYDGYRMVFASDVTHFSLMHEPLASTIAKLLRPDDGVCILSHQERMFNLKGQDMQLEDFIQMARSKRLHVERLPSVQQQQHYDDGGSQNMKSKVSMLLIKSRSDKSVSELSPLYGVG
mmetsp:Transcript_22032/g.32548  ORF Transcript_22032/g.32548 Transcript_22032/m.32548 type:complete len:342 (+) Transcript_22032:91-1116(+)|eukprot:CAMPEP_0194207686 /NCGR_PEP_ID=MMETSP0156-20130528/6349_1 /TAXON_ID=33649 /ORGANISM="Thalassionema nitzschioides, Strain L26-B" /LENGTH=341 /DNA_ID=CAMNT_0038934499 /DNA_START=21 /DNA_END=1046 /DNA_ORIENTATION=+